MKSILFDLDDTLYDRSIPFIEAFDAMFGKQHAALAVPAYKTSNFRSVKAVADRQAGLISEDEMNIYRYRIGFADIGFEITDAQALEFQQTYKEMQKHLCITPRIRTMLEFCNANFRHTGIITNGNGPHQRHKLQIMGLDELIDPELIFVSAECGCIKPERRIFEMVQEKLGIEKAVFAGDNYLVDILGARQLNWETILFDRNTDDPTKFPEADHIVYNEQELDECVRSLA